MAKRNIIRADTLDELIKVVQGQEDRLAKLEIVPEEPVKVVEPIKVEKPKKKGKSK